jgi:transposase-like protein
VAKAKRRRFTAEYKQKILREADACVEPGAIGALMRREGLYSSHLVEWRRLRERGELAGLEAKRRGPKPKEPNPLAKKLAEQEREIAKLKAENAKLHLICDVQKKSRSSWA